LNAAILLLVAIFLCRVNFDIKAKRPISPANSRQCGPFVW